MGLRDLISSSMIAIGDRCTTLEPDGIRGLLEADAVLKIYPAQFEIVTAPLSEMEATVGTIEGEIGELTVQINEADTDGDALIGGFDDLTTGSAAVCGVVALAAAIIAARDAALGSDGRARLVKAPYLALTGEATQMEKRLKPEHWQTLDQIRIAQISASDVLRYWMSLARSISKKEIRRGELRSKNDASEITRGQVAKARNNWIRVANSFLSAVEISGLTEEQRALVLTPIQEAERSAVENRLRRVATAAAKAAESSTAAPSDTPPTNP